MGSSSPRDEVSVCFTTNGAAPTLKENVTLEDFYRTHLVESQKLPVGRKPYIQLQPQKVQKANIIRPTTTTTSLDLTLIVTIDHVRIIVAT